VKRKEPYVNENKITEMKEKLLLSMGEIDERILNEAFSVDSKEKYARLTPNKKKRYGRYSSIAASFLLIVCVGILLPRIGDFQTKDEAVHIPEGESGIYNDNKHFNEDFPHIEGKLVISSGDMWNYYSACKAIYDSALRASSKNSPTLLHTGDGNKDPELPQESGYGVTDGAESSGAFPGDDIVYYDLKEFGELRITEATYFCIELKEKNGFLASKLGLGKVEVVITKISDFDSMITFRNGDKYYSCLENGLNEFSTHKYIDGFFVVKNETPDTCSFTIEYDKKGNVTAFDCSIRSSRRFLPDEADVIEGSTRNARIEAGYSIEELEDFFNSKEA